MEKKNFVFRVNATELQYFCQLQVSNKFMKSAEEEERQLMAFIVENFVHRTATAEQVWEVHDELLHQVVKINDSRRDGEPFLVLTYQPLCAEASGFFRIERSSGRHQSLLLPVIDCRGSVCF